MHCIRSSWHGQRRPPMARHPTRSSTSCSTTSRPATQCSPTALSTRRTSLGSPTKCLRLQQQTCRIVGAKPQREPRSIPMSHYGPRSLGGYVEPSLTPTVSSSTSVARSDCSPPKPEPPPNCWSPLAPTAVAAFRRRCATLITAANGRATVAQPIRPIRCHSADPTTGGNTRTTFEVDAPVVADCS